MKNTVHAFETDALIPVALLISLMVMSIISFA